MNIAIEKYTIHIITPEQFLHPFTVVGGFKFCIALSLFLNGLMQTLLSFIKIVFPMYYRSILNN